MIRSCFHPTNSCTCCALGLSLVPAHRMTPTKTASSIQRKTRRGRRGCRISGGRASTTAGLLGGELTGFPHFRQNCASSGRLAPHLLHPSMTLVTGGVVLFVAILSGLRSASGSANHQAHFPRRRVRISGAETPADISTGSGGGICSRTGHFNAPVPYQIREEQEHPAPAQ